MNVETVILSTKKYKDRTIMTGLAVKKDIKITKTTDKKLVSCNVEFPS